MGQESAKHEKAPSNLTEERKADHIQICLEKDVKAKYITTGFKEIFLVHRALPEIDRDKINLSTVAFNHKFSAPIIVEAMTGGTKNALEINAAIAQAVEEMGLGMGVGSQRIALENPRLERTFKVARKRAPNAFLIANIGGPQLVRGYGIKEMRKIINMIEADALAIHLNPLQEAIQPEGETSYAGILNKIGGITREIKVPVIVKETGAGIASEEAKNLESVGVSAIDIAGAGGTSWAAVEYYRAKQRGDDLAQRIGEALWDWGIPTAISLIEVTQSVNLPVIASGGLRSGEDAVKALALGASLAGFASPILGPALRGDEEVKKSLTLLVHQLRNVMFLTGAGSIDELRKVPLVITGKTADWLHVRGFKPEVYARREG